MQATPETTTQVPRARRPPPRALQYAAVLLVLCAWCALFRDSYIDDAFITFQYARNLAFHGTWGLLSDRIANSATSPLHVLVLAALMFIIRSPLLAVYISNVLTLGWLCLLLQRLARHVSAPPMLGWLCFAGLALNPLLFSTLGMETYLFITLFILALVNLSARRPILLGVTLALLALTRFDAMLALPIMLAVYPGWRARLRIATAWTATLLPWLLVSWFFLGSFLPDSLFIKTGEGPWGGVHTFANGVLFYYHTYPIETIWTLMFLPAALGALRRWPAPIGRMLIATTAYAILHSIAYTLLRVAPFHWYYAPELLAITLTGACALGAPRGAADAQPNPRPAQAMLSLTVLIFAVWLATQHGVVSEVPFQNNWARQTQYREIGLRVKELATNQTAIYLLGEIGTLAFYSERPLLDHFSDRRFLRGQFKGAISRPGLRGLAARINFHWLKLDPRPLPPADYYLEGIPQGGAFRPPWPHYIVWNTESRSCGKGYVTYVSQADVLAGQAKK